MEEFLTVSCNFKIAVDVIIAGQHVVGKVEKLELDDGRAQIDGKWYPIKEMEWVIDERRDKRDGDDRGGYNDPRCDHVSLHVDDVSKELR